MARRSLLRTKPKKKVRSSELTNRLVNQKYLGKCPPVSDRAGFLAWCAYMVETREAREWLDEYLKPSGRSSRGVPDRWINPSVCFRCRLKSTGAPFSGSQERLLEEGIEAMLLHVEEAPEGEAGAKPTVADRVRERFSEVMGEVEGMIDDGIPEGFSVEAWYREKSVSPTVARRVMNKLIPVQAELLAAYEGKDPELNEGYARVGRGAIRKLLLTYNRIIADTMRLLDNDKRARAPRKPKPVSVEKKLKHLSAVYQKYSREFNVNSVDPSRVIGAQELWTLNTKYKLLTVYRAESHGGQLDVSRCRVTGFNRNDSKTYRLGRKSEKLVAEALKSSRAGMKKLVSGLKEAPLAERVNENTVLLRV